MVPLDRRGRDLYLPGVVQPDRLRDLIDSSPTAAAIIESDGWYSYLNRAFTDLFGYTLADIPTGREWFRRAFLDPDLRNEAIATWRADLAQAVRGTLPGRFPSGVGMEGRR